MTTNTTTTTTTTIAAATAKKYGTFQLTDDISIYIKAGSEKQMAMTNPIIANIGINLKLASQEKDIRINSFKVREFASTKKPGETWIKIGGNGYKNNKGEWMDDVSIDDALLTEMKTLILNTLAMWKAQELPAPAVVVPEPAVEESVSFEQVSAMMATIAELTSRLNAKEEKEAKPAKKTKKATA